MTSDFFSDLFLNSCTPLYLHGWFGEVLWPLVATSVMISVFEIS